jgi:hypothetical protein
MARKRQFGPPRQTRRNPGGFAPPPVAIPREAKPPVVYGKPFVLLEDENRNTFTYKSGAWVPHSISIAEYRRNAEVNELPQKVNRMTRYEIRCPIEMAP